MIDNLTGEDDTVSLMHAAVDPNLIAAAGAAQQHEILTRPAIVIVEHNPARDSLPNDVASLFCRQRPMEAQREDNEDVAIGNATSIHFVDKNGKKHVAVHETRDVVYEDRHTLARMETLS